MSTSSAACKPKCNSSTCCIHRLEEFSFKNLTPDYLSGVSSKAKAKLTRTYNSMNHRSQALATEPPLGGRKRKPAAEGSLEDVADDGVARDAPVVDEDDDEDDEAGAAAGAGADKFRKKQRATSKGKSKAKPKSKAASASAAKRSRK